MRGLHHRHRRNSISVTTSPQPGKQTGEAEYAKVLRRPVANLVSGLASTPSNDRVLESSLRHHLDELGAMENAISYKVVVRYAFKDPYSRIAVEEKPSRRDAPSPQRDTRLGYHLPTAGWQSGEDKFFLIRGYRWDASAQKHLPPRSLLKRRPLSVNPEKR